MVKFPENDPNSYCRVRHILHDFVKDALPTIKSRLQGFSKGTKREMHVAEKGKTYNEGVDTIF
jgi:hypothetical protein